MTWLHVIVAAASLLSIVTAILAFSAVAMMARRLRDARRLVAALEANRSSALDYVRCADHHLERGRPAQAHANVAVAAGLLSDVVVASPPGPVI